MLMYGQPKMTYRWDKFTKETEYKSNPSIENLYPELTPYGLQGKIFKIKFVRI